MKVKIKTYLEDFPYSDYETGDYWIGLDAPYCKEVYARQYKMNGGMI